MYWLIFQPIPFFVYIHSHSNSEQKHPQNSSTRNPVKRHRAAAGTCRPHHRRPHRRRRDNRCGFGRRNDVQPYILELRISAHGDKRTDSAGIRRARQATDVGDAVSLGGTGTAARHRHRGTAVAHKMAAARRHLPKRGCPHPRLAIFLHHNLGRARHPRHDEPHRMVYRNAELHLPSRGVDGCKCGQHRLQPMFRVRHAAWIHRHPLRHTCGTVVRLHPFRIFRRQNDAQGNPRICSTRRRDAARSGTFFQRQPRHLPTQPVRNGCDAVFHSYGCTLRQHDARRQRPVHATLSALLPFHGRVCIRRRGSRWQICRRRRQAFAATLRVASLCMGMESRRNIRFRLWRLQPRSNVAVQRQTRGRSVCRSLPMVDSPRSDSRYGGVYLGRRVCRTYRHPTDAVVARRRDSSLFRHLFSFPFSRRQQQSLDSLFDISRRQRRNIMAMFCPQVSSKEPFNIITQPLLL